VFRLVPGGWGGAAGVPLGGPPERSRAEAARLELVALVGSLGGAKAATNARGCSRSSVVGWKSGRRALPRHALGRLRAACTSQATTSASSGEGRRGGAGGMDAVVCKYRSLQRVHREQLSRLVAGDSRVSEEAVIAGPKARPDPSEDFSSPLVSV